MYQLRAPAPELAPFVEHYWFVTSDEGPVDLRVDVFVDARADLVFNFGAPYLREVILGATTHHERSTFDAQRTVPIRIVQRGLVRIAGVRFRLGGVAPFVRTPLRPFTGRTPPPASVLGPEAEALDRALEAEPDVDRQARLLDAFFGARLSLDAGHAAFADALAHLVETDGNATVEALAQRASVSARHLGLAPKTVGRVLRFQRTLRALMQDPGCSLAEIAQGAGYFDQAHFIKDFKRMTGGVPRGYRGYYPPAGPSDFAPNVVVFLQDGADLGGRR